MKTFIGTVLALGLVAMTTAGELRQDKGDKGKPEQGKPVPASSSALAAKMQEFGTPGPSHKVLDSRVGRWNLDVKMYEPGSTTPSESRGTSEVKWIMDGRFLQESCKGEWMGKPFEGAGTLGYDNLKQKYVSTWIDNMSTGVMYAEGTYDAASKSFTFTGECPDLMAGKYSRFRSVEKMIDADHWQMQSFKPGPDGKDALMAQIDYVRAK